MVLAGGAAIYNFRGDPVLEERIEEYTNALADEWSNSENEQERSWAPIVRKMSEDIAYIPAIRQDTSIGVILMNISDGSIENRFPKLISPTSHCFYIPKQ